MAIWQFSIDFIPIRKLISEIGDVPKIGDDDLFEALGYGVELPADYRTLLTELGTGSPLKWIPDSLNWGDYDNGSHLTIYSPGTNKTHIYSRLHVGEWDEKFARAVLYFAVQIECVLYTKNETIIEPDYDGLIDEVKRSSSYRFCLNPTAYLQSDEVKRIDWAVRTKLGL